MSAETSISTHPGTPPPGPGCGQGYSAISEGAATSRLGSPPGPGGQPRKKARASRTAVASSASRPTLLDDILADLGQRLDALQTVAMQHREPRPDDAVADGMDWAIGRFRAALAEIDANYEYLSTDQYAALYGVTPQSVCNWIRQGEVDAVDTPNGWRIKRRAQRQQKRRPM